MLRLLVRRRLFSRSDLIKLSGGFRFAVAFDGLIDNSVSSSFSEEEWKKYIEEKVV